MPWSVIERAVSEATGKSFAIRHRRPVGGGCINESFRVESDDQALFVKLNHRRFADMFDAEFEGLEELAAANAIRVPKPLCRGVADDQAFIAMEHVSMGPPQAGSQARLGRGMARLHRVSGTAHGWHRDNTIGSTPQINTIHENWAIFHRECRLRPQFEMAARNGGTFPLAETLLDAVDSFFGDYHPLPSLLHGDLWSGNVGFDKSGDPVIFDPATFHGDRESDFALGSMFGGFTAEFFRAYDSEFPRDHGWRRRIALYRLYHELNHFNLFGGGYASSAERSISELLTLP